MILLGSELRIKGTAFDCSSFGGAPFMGILRLYNLLQSILYFKSLFSCFLFSELKSVLVFSMS